MEEYQQRVIDEMKELDAKRTSLESFLKSEKMRELPLGEQQRLETQYGVMSLYVMVLSQRIAAFA